MKVEVKKSDRKNAPEGLHPARLIQIIGLGTQTNETYNKKEKRVRIAWELLGVTFETEEGEEVNHLISKEYSLKLSKKSHLRKMIESMQGKSLKDGEDFDLESIADAPCQINVKWNKSDKTGEMYANVDSVLPPPTDPKTKKPLKLDRATRDTIVFDIDNIDDNVLSTLPEWLQDVIMKSDEYVAYTDGGFAEKDKASKKGTTKPVPAKKVPAKKVAPKKK